MSQEKTYHPLIAGQIYMGSANDVQDMVERDGVQVIVDLREESTGCAAPNADVVWTKIPLDDKPDPCQAPLFKEAINAVVAAYRDGKRVGFHCGGGKGRTGTVAAGVLLELGMCGTLSEAETMAKALRPVLKIKPEQHVALAKLYPQS